MLQLLNELCPYNYTTLRKGSLSLGLRASQRWAEAQNDSTDVRIFIVAWVVRSGFVGNVQNGVLPIILLIVSRKKNLTRLGGI